MAAASPRALKIFYCYAHEDRPLRDELGKHLSALRRSGQVTEWFDQEIRPGTEWKHEIDVHLNTADIVLLLVSADFMDSDYCYGVEMQRALQRHKAGEAYVIPIILRPTDWKETPIGDLQALPSAGKAIVLWSVRDEAFEDVARGIRDVVRMTLKAEEEKVRRIEEEQARKAEEEKVRRIEEEQARKAEEDRILEAGKRQTGPTIERLYSSAVELVDHGGGQKPQAIISPAPTAPLSHAPIPVNSAKSLNQSSLPSSSPVQPGWAALPSVLPPPVTPGQPKRRISRRVVLFSLVGLGGLVVLVIGMIWLAFSLRPPSSAGTLVTITGIVNSVDATNGSVTLTVNGQDVTINGLSSAQVVQLQSQLGITYTITAGQNSDGSYTIATGSNTIIRAIGTGSASTPVAGTIAFIGKVQSSSSNSVVVSLPNGSTLSMAIVNGLTDLSDFNGALPAAGATIKVDANANTDGSYTATKLGQALQSDLSNPTKLNTVLYQGVTIAAVGPDRVIHYTVGNKSYSFTIGTGADLFDFNNNAQSIQANQKVKVEVLFSGSNGTVTRVSLNHGQ